MTDLHHHANARSMWRVAAIGVAGVALLASCGDDDEGGADTSAAGQGATTIAAGPNDPPVTTGASPTTGGDGAPTTGGSTATTTGGSVQPGLASVATADTDLGTVLVDAEGFTLYAFLNDTEGEPTCFEACAEAWPPALIEGEPAFGDLDPAVFSVVENPAGQQLKAGDWPLYTFAADEAPGDVNGQGSGDVWFAVTPEGELVQ